jgi:hypothetical protein
MSAPRPREYFVETLSKVVMLLTDADVGASGTAMIQCGN